MKRGGTMWVRLLALAFASSACSTTHFAWQAIKGQWKLSQRARPIEEVLLLPGLSDSKRELLRLVPDVKKFVELSGLKATLNYTQYVEWDQPYVSTVVTACEELAFNPKIWRFPIVGEWNYIGFFDPEDAKKLEAELRMEGWDTDVRGARAFSTLGWFRDPVISTMLLSGAQAKDYLVEVLIHESVHATVFIKGEPNFNESLAEFVARKLTPIYLGGKFGQAQAKNYLREVSESEALSKRFHETSLELEKLYARSIAAEEKRAEKAKLIARLQSEFPGFRKINNATLIHHRTYESGTTELDALWKACGEEPRRFLNRIEEWARREKGDLIKKLAGLKC